MWTVMEFDLRVTKDGVVVLHHDSYLTDPDGKRRNVDSHTYKQLKRHKKDLATFEEVLQKVGHPVTLYVEIKPEARLGPIIKILNYYMSIGWKPDYFRLMSFNQDILLELQRKLPNIEKVVLERWSGIRATRRARQLGTKNIIIKQRWLWWGFIGSMTRGGWHLGTYTVDDPAKARRWARWGLDMVVTDLSRQVRIMKAIFDHAKDEASNIRTFYFRPEKPAHYTAGQYTELALPHPHPDKRGGRRWFTLSSSPTEDLLSITTKYAGDDDTSSFKRTLFKLKPGSEVHMADPMGDFVLPKLIQTPLVFVAGGIGITPFHSMLEWLVGYRRRTAYKVGVRRAFRGRHYIRRYFRAGRRPAHHSRQPAVRRLGRRARPPERRAYTRTGKPSEDTLVYLSGPGAYGPGPGQGSS